MPLEIPLKSERRLFDRFFLNYPSRLLGVRESTDFNVFLQDASAGGASFVISQNIPLNTPISLDVELPENKPRIKLEGRVIWSQKCDTNLWNIGFCFNKIDFLHISRLYDPLTPSFE